VSTLSRDELVREVRSLRALVHRLEKAAAEREATAQAHMENRWQAERRAEEAEKELKWVLSLRLLTPADHARIEGLFL